MTASAHSSAAHVPAAVASVISVFFVFIGEEDGINERIRALGRFDAALQAFFAAAIHAVGQDDESFASLLLSHEFIRSEVHGIVEQGAATSAVRAMAAARIVSRSGLGEFRRAQVLERYFEFLARRSEVLQEVHFVIELDDEGFVLVFAQGVIEEGVAGVALLVQNAPLAQARVHQETQRQRKIGILREIADGLRVAILIQHEIVLGQVANEKPMLVAHGGEHAYHFDVHGDGRGLQSLRALLAAQRRRDEWKQYEQEERRETCPATRPVS